MKNLVALVEGYSEKELLCNFLPRMFPGMHVNGTDSEISNLENLPYFGLNFTCLRFEGKPDLLKQCADKLRDWNVPDSVFLILCDMDNDNCRDLKNRLDGICRKSGKSNIIIRIACQELESWYFGDLQAVESALSLSGNMLSGAKKARQNPDALVKPSLGLKKLTQGAYRKISGSRAIGKFLDIDPSNNSSKSFRVFVEGVKRSVAELGELGD